MDWLKQISAKKQGTDDSTSALFKRGYVLVVDDEPNMCKTIRNMLAGFDVNQVVEACDGSIALDILKNPDHPKLEKLNGGAEKKCLFALLDWNMPRVTGISVAQEMRSDKNLKDIPMLMVTAESSRERIVQASAEVGVNGYIIKPFVAKDLEVKMMGILKKRATPPEHIKLLMAGETLFEQGKFDSCIALLTKALELSPDSARIRVLLGDALKEKGAYGEAGSVYARAMEKNPNYLKVYESSADLFMKEGKKDDALSSLKKAAELSPCNAKRQAAMGKIYLEKGDVAEAEKAFRGALALDSKMANEIAEVFLASGQDELAEEYFRRSLPEIGQHLTKKEREEYVHTANRLGIALRKQGKLKEAISEYKKACKLAPNDEVIYYNMGKAYEMLSAKESASDYLQEALKCFRKAMEFDPDFQEARMEVEKYEKLAA